MRKAKNKWRPCKRTPKKPLCLLQCRTAGCICEIARVEAAAGMSSSAVAPIKRRRNFQTPTADASTPGELDRTAPLNKPDKHHGTSRASRRHHECVSPCWNIQPGHMPGDVFRSLPSSDTLGSGAPFVRSVLSPIQPGRKSLSTLGVKGFPYTVAEGNLQRSDSPSHRRLRHHGARWAPAGLSSARASLT